MYKKDHHNIPPSPTGRRKASHAILQMADPRDYILTKTEGGKPRHTRLLLCLRGKLTHIFYVRRTTHYRDEQNAPFKVIFRGARHAYPARHFLPIPTGCSPNPEMNVDRQYMRASVQHLRLPQPLLLLTPKSDGPSSLMHEIRRQWFVPHLVPNTFKAPLPPPATAKGFVYKTRYQKRCQRESRW